MKARAFGLRVYLRRRIIARSETTLIRSRTKQSRRFCGTVGWVTRACAPPHRPPRDLRPRACTLNDDDARSAAVWFFFYSFPEIYFFFYLPAPPARRHFSPFPSAVINYYLFVRAYIMSTKDPYLKTKNYVSCCFAF